MLGEPALEPRVLFLASARSPLGWADRPAEAETAHVVLGAYHAPRVVLYHLSRAEAPAVERPTRVIRAGVIREWKRRVEADASTAVAANHVVPASTLREAQQRIQELERLPGRSRWSRNPPGGAIRSAIVSVSRLGTTRWHHSRFLCGQAGADPPPEPRACRTPGPGIVDLSKHAASDPKPSFLAAR